MRSRVLLLTGTCGSGKTTVSTLLAERDDRARICEDDLWLDRFGHDRGALESGRKVVIDATVHEAPPHAYEEYMAEFERHRIRWTLRALYPRGSTWRSTAMRHASAGRWVLRASGSRTTNSAARCSAVLVLWTTPTRRLRTPYGGCSMIVDA